MNRRDVLKLSGAAIAVVALPLPQAEVPLDMLRQHDEAEGYAAFVKACLSQIALAMSVPYATLAQEYPDSGQGLRVRPRISADRFELVKGEVHGEGRQDRLRFIV